MALLFSITKYTKPTFSKMTCDNSLFKPIYCKGCYIYFTTDYKSEIRVFVENPYSNEYTDTQERDDNILVYDGGVGSATEEFVNDLISFVDGKCNTIDAYVNLIDKTLRDEGFSYKGTTLGFELVSATRDDDIKFGKYSTLVTFNNGDSFDVACDKLEVAFDSPVDRARDVISSLTSYGVVATTYNTTRGSGTFCVEASEVIESFLYWYYKSESTKGVKRCCIDSELYKYVTITGIIFKNLCLGNTSDLQIDVVCSINSGEDSKVRDLIDTLNTPMNMFAHINGGSLDISLLLKS